MIRLCFAAMVAYCSYAMCRTPLLPLFARELGAGPSTVGFVMGASTITGIIVKLPAGALSDHLGRQRVLLVGALIFAALPFGYLAVSTLAMLVALRFLHGSATAIFGPVASASLSDLAPAAQRGWWLSMLSTGQGAGQTLGAIMSGYLIASAGYNAAFLAAGLIGLVVPIVLLDRRGAASAASKRVTWEAFCTGVSEVVRDPIVLATSSMQAAQFVLNGALNAFLPLYGRDVLGLTTPQLGWLFAAQTATTLAIRPVIGRMSDRIDRRRVIVAGVTVCSAAVWALSLTGTAAIAFIVIVIYAAGVATTTAATSAHITDITRQARYGSAHGVFGTIYDIGDALGPIAAGLLVASAGYERMFQAIALIAAAATVSFVITMKRHDGRGIEDSAVP